MGSWMNFLKLIPAHFNCELPDFVVQILVQIKKQLRV